MMVNFTQAEDMEIPKVYVMFATDLVVGRYQDSETFWDKIKPEYHRTFGTRTNRTRKSLQNRMSALKTDCRIFAGIVAAYLRNPPSRWTDEQMYIEARVKFVEGRGGKPWKHDMVFAVLRHRVEGCDLENLRDHHVEASQSTPISMVVSESEDGDGTDTVTITQTQTRFFFFFFAKDKPRGLRRDKSKMENSMAKVAERGWNNMIHFFEKKDAVKHEEKLAENEMMRQLVENGTRDILAREKKPHNKDMAIRQKDMEI
ncbi:uncharacterized protein LOC113305928 [Papaver somniferum]|uniref:uncharacterized protein LOC113305928 n=1 Tax=Papaver somniferum TaxID=3469 RepID=UPI000E6FCFA3|nr:uncharacterized protein LOC113305928 [Papaver somniferum]